MKGLFLDATGDLHDVFKRVLRPDDPPIVVNFQDKVAPEDLPGLCAGYDFLIDDHTFLPTEAIQRCTGIKDIIFLGTGARSYMHPDELAKIGVFVHIIKGYGDTAVAEHAITLIWSAARGIARMDRAMRDGRWLITEGVQLTGKTLGLLAFGGIAAEVARIAVGSGMRVIAWNRSPKTAPGVTFVDLDTLLAESDVLSVHLLLSDETRGFVNAERLAKLKRSAILVNTARGAVIDEPALVAALEAGQIRHAALDVFTTEPLPQGHPLTRLENVTLSAHSGFCTPEATETLLRRAVDIAKSLG